MSAELLLRVGQSVESRKSVYVVSIPAVFGCFFAGFFGVPTGPLTGLFFLSQNEDIKIIQANIQCTVILTVAAFFSYFYFINGYEKNYLVLGLLMSLPLAVGLKTGQLLFNILPEKIFRPVTYSCLIILGATLSFNAYE